MRVRSVRLCAGKKVELGEQSTSQLKEQNPNAWGVEGSAFAESLREESLREEAFPKNCLSIYEVGSSHQEFANYLPDAARADQDSFIDFNSPFHLTTATLTEKQLSELSEPITHVEMEFYKPIKIKARVHLENGNSLFTQDRVAFFSNGLKSGKLNYFTQVAKLTREPARNGVFFYSRKSGFGAVGSAA